MVCAPVKVTFVIFKKLEPVITTTVPPSTLPWLGFREEMIGAGIGVFVIVQVDVSVAVLVAVEVAVFVAV